MLSPFVLSLFTSSFALEISSFNTFKGSSIKEELKDNANSSLEFLMIFEISLPSKFLFKIDRIDSLKNSII